MRRFDLYLKLVLLVSFVLLMGCNSNAPPGNQANNTSNVSQELPPSQPERKEKPLPVAVEAQFQPVEYTYAFPAEGIPILMYHSIADLPGNNLGVPPAKFAEQMKFLYDSGYTTISPETLYNAYQGTGKLPKKPVLLTFDDGYPDNYSVAFPVLKQYNFVATFFVITGAIDNGMLTWAQLQEMKNYGMSIQSHTVSHPDLRTLSGAELKKEIVNSKNVIENKLNTRVKLFCYPSGKYNEETLKQLKQAGYAMAVTTVYGTASRSQDPLLLNRIRINGNSTLQTFIKQLTPSLKTKK